MPSGLFHTQNTIGIREDLTDILTNISPSETPFLSSIQRTKASNSYHEWQTITLASAATAGANSNVEGCSATPGSGNTTTRIGNRTQLMMKTLRLSSTVMAVNEAGRANEMSFQMNLKLKELALDANAACILQSAAAAGDVTGETARQFEGWGLSDITNATAGFLSANVKTLLTTASDTGTRKNMSETDFNGLLQTIWESGGNPDTIYVNGYLKRVISNFSANATRYSSVDFGDKRLNAAVNVYESDFGQVTIKLERAMPKTNVAAIETQYWGIAELQPVQYTKLATDGPRISGMWTWEFTLCAYAPAASGKLIGAASAAGATT